MTDNPVRLARLIAMIAFKEALDVQMDILEFEIQGMTNENIKNELIQELLRVTNENLSASRDILNISRELRLTVTDIDVVD